MIRKTPRRIPADRGAGSVEYVGIVAVVVVIIVALVMQATPIGGTIAAEICRAFGTECGTSTGTEEATPIPEPTRACTVLSNSEDYAVEGSVMFIDGGAGLQFRREVKSDGTIDVTVLGSVEGGGSVKAPGAEAEISGGVIENVPLGGDGDVGVSANADAGWKVGAGFGQVFTFEGDDAAAQADRLIEFTKWKQGATAVGALGHPALGVASGFLAEMSYKWFNDYEPPAPSATLFEARGGVEASADADVLLGGVGAEGEAEGVLGFRFNADGSTTVHLEGGIGASGEASFFTAGGELSGNAALVGEVTLDSDGNLIEVAMAGAASGEGSIGITDLFGNPLSDLSASGGQGVVARAQVDVTDANRAQVLEALARAGLPLVRADLVGAGDDYASASEALDFLMTESQRTGGTTLEYADVSSDTMLAAALGGRLPGVGGANLGFSATSGEEKLNDAFYLAETGWVNWRNCTR
ncbi:hypothetical protein [Microbacterium sp. NPDC096154]|uniref:hypothetical protein n=1 Tax=Microbacterium sp. NPDC096154 TaxID=3155549 RepID=UPI003324917B